MLLPKKVITKKQLKSLRCNNLKLKKIFGGMSVVLSITLCR